MSEYLVGFDRIVFVEPFEETQQRSEKEVILPQEEGRELSTVTSF